MTDEEHSKQHNDLQADELLVQPLRERLLQLIDNNEDDAIDEAEVRRLCADEHALRRFLVARLNKLEATYKMAYEMLKWRSQIHPDQLTVEDFPTANSQEVWRFAGYAKNGWPIILIKACNWDPAKHSVEEYVKMVAFFLETNEKRMNPARPDARNYMIFDMKGMSYLKSDMRKIRQLAKLTADYYPERLGLGVALNADVVFWSIWKIIAPVLDKRTRDKARIFRGDFADFLEEHVGLDNVAENLGGTRAEEWPPVTAENQHTFTWHGTNSILTKRQETADTVESSADSVVAEE